jgi:phosphoribosylaminoimidazole carboxylase PurE protein
MTIDDTFKKAVESGVGCAVVFAGSGSDKEHIKKITDALAKYGIPRDVRICSAHKQPEELMQVVREYEALKGPFTYIAVAGGTDALSGTLSWHVLRPVLSCAPDSPNESCLTNPPGSSNATIRRADNTARFIAQQYAHLNPAYQGRLEAEKASKVDGLRTDDADLGATLRGP